MTKQEKIKIVDDLYDELSSCSCFYIINPEGLNVSSVNHLRKKCFQAGIRYKVIKNTFIKKSIERITSITNNSNFVEFFDKTLVGASGIFILDEVSNKPASLLKLFRKELETTIPIFKGAFVDGDFFIGENSLEILVKLKSKNELIADLIYLLESPTKTTLSSLESGKNILSGLVKTLATRL